MKKLFTILIFAILFGGSAMAYDFSAVCESGQTLYYNITSNTVPYTVEVTYESGDGPYNTFPTGDLTISETVEYNSITYSVTSIGTVAFGGCTGLTSLTIPNSVRTIYQEAFMDCTGITSIVFGNSLTNIGELAFANCTGLTSVTIPNSVTSIGGGAFGSCTGLTSVTIPNSVTSIGNYAFENCSVTSVTIPNSVTSIGDGAFSDCFGLTSVYYTGDLAGWCRIEFGGFGSNPVPYSHNLYINNELVTDLIIPETISEIKAYAFFGASCITSLTIPNSITSIGNEAFLDCSGLASVYYTGNIAQWCGIVFGGFGSNPVPYSHNLYINNELVTDLIIPETISEIKAYAFFGASCITSLTIPNSVTSIGYHAFYNCSGLTSVTIGNSVNSIGDYAFYYCWRLEKIYSNAETPATIETNTFSSTVPIFVPCGAENNYLADEQWGSLNINSELPHFVTLNSNDEAMGTAVLLNQHCSSSTAVIEARPRYGYNFVHWNDGNTDNPRTITVTEDVIYTATFEVGDGIEENNMESKISLFPNPATDILNITSSETISEIEIVNTLGQVVKRIEVNADNAVCDVNELKAGVYMVRIRSAKSDTSTTFSVRRFVKE